MGAAPGISGSSSRVRVSPRCSFDSVSSIRSQQGPRLIGLVQSLTALQSHDGPFKAELPAEHEASALELKCEALKEVVGALVTLSGAFVLSKDSQCRKLCGKFRFCKQLRLPSSIWVVSTQRLECISLLGRILL